MIHKIIINNILFLAFNYSNEIYIDNLFKLGYYWNKHGKEDFVNDIRKYFDDISGG